MVVVKSHRVMEGRGRGGGGRYKKRFPRVSFKEIKGESSFSI